MSPELRSKIALGRAGDYFDIMKTVMFGFVAVAAILEFGPDRYSAPIAALVVTLTAYGILAGSAAMDDLAALREDLDEETRRTSYGKALTSRNFNALKMVSGVLIAITGLAELYAVII